MLWLYSQTILLVQVRLHPEMRTLPLRTLIWNKYSASTVMCGYRTYPTVSPMYDCWGRHLTNIPSDRYPGLLPESLHHHGLDIFTWLAHIALSPFLGLNTWRSQQSSMYQQVLDSTGTSQMCVAVQHHDTPCEQCPGLMMMSGPQMLNKLTAYDLSCTKTSPQQ